jgi:hypothetical protein
MTSHQPTKSPAGQVLARARVLAATIAVSLLMLPARIVQARSDTPKIPGPLHSQRSAPNLLHDAPDPQKFWPTPFGPPYANIITEPTNFLPCRGGPFALCYYSGPAPLPCTVDADGRFATCECLDITYGTYFVDINAILDHAVYQQTVKACGVDGSGCTCPERDAIGKCIPAPVNTAPVCNYINRQKLLPGADLISTFSFDCAAEEPIGVTKCGPGTYAGCMTAPCQETGEEGTVECRCPLFDGPFEVGKDGETCSLTDPPGVWSAAHNVSSSGSDAVTFPTLDVSTCTPDLPEDHGGCPLLPAGPLPPQPPDSVCGPVCDEYTQCLQQGIQVGFTCDAVLCTHTCTSNDLVSDACGGLGSCETTSIIQLETEMGCSCCASQICRCDANAATQAKIAELDQEQRDRGITPQCDLNGTLCGAP